MALFLSELFHEFEYHFFTKRKFQVRFQTFFEQNRNLIKLLSIQSIMSFFLHRVCQMEFIPEGWIKNKLFDYFKEGTMN